jgi:hypothetical protein
LRTKKVLLPALLLSLFLPIAVWADSVALQNPGGPITPDANVLSLNDSTVSFVKGLGGLSTNPLSLAFATGPLVSATMAAGATFGAGGSFIITGGDNTVLFRGTFAAPRLLRGRESSSYVSVDDGVISLSVPEPSTISMLTAGLIFVGGLFGCRRTRNQSNL